MQNASTGLSVQIINPTLSKAILCLVLLGSCSAKTQQPTQDTSTDRQRTPHFELWMTTQDLTKHLSQEPSPEIVSGVEPTIQVETGQSFQQIDGFGAAFTDTSSWLLHGMTPSNRDAVMQKLFDQTEGIHLSLMRVPMGSSDFTRTGPYSYADAPEDDTLPQFTTRHDEEYIIPILRQAQQMNPAMRLFANPWSPPAWMKTNNSMLGTWKHATLLSGKYAALSTYFVKFLQEYQNKGVHVWGITPQNEPDLDPASYSGMYLSPEDQSRFIVRYLVPAFRKAGLQPVIMAGDVSTANPVYARALFHDPAVLSLVQATAWHCYQDLAGFASGLTEINRLVPSLPMYISECSTGPGGHIAGDTTEKTLVALNNGAAGMVLWNLALDPKGGPKMGVGCEQCTGLVTIDPATSHYEYTLNYYELGQFSKFIIPGAHKLKSSDGGGISAQAFRNPDGSIVIVAYNNQNDDKDVTIRVDRELLKIKLPAHATATAIGVTPHAT